MTELTDAWKCLKQDSSGDVGLATIRLATHAPCGIFAAVVKPSNLPALVVEVHQPAVPQSTVLPKSRGLDVRTEAVEIDSSRLVRFVAVLTDAKYEELLAYLGEDLVNRVTAADSEQKAVAVLLKRLGDWQSFLRRFGAEGLE